MKTLTISIVLLLVSIKTFSQDNLEDVVYLKNGSVIRGVIIEQIPGAPLKIQTKDRNVFSFQMSEVEKITNELFPSEQSINKVKPKFLMDSVRAKGYCGIYEFGGLFGFAGNNVSKYVVFKNGSYFKFSQPYFTLKAVQGYHLNRKLFLGAGTGLDVTGGGRWESLILPVFMEVRGFFIKNRVAPFVSQQTGYAMEFTRSSITNGWDKTFAGGFQSESKVGFRVMIDKRASFNFSVGYRMQHLAKRFSVVDYSFSPQYVWGAPNTSNQSTLTPYWVHTFLHFVSIKTGFSF